MSIRINNPSLACELTLYPAGFYSGAGLIGFLIADGLSSAGTFMPVAWAVGLASMLVITATVFSYTWFAWSGISLERGEQKVSGAWLGIALAVVLSTCSAAALALGLPIQWLARFAVGLTAIAWITKACRNRR